MLVELQHLAKSYFTEDLECQALRDITLTIERGEYVAVEGPSGCGKTTLLSVLGLIDTPTSGRFLLGGNPVDDLSEFQRTRIRNREIGFVFQNFNLIGDLSVEENVEIPLVYRGMIRSQRRLRVTEVLDRVRLSHRARHFPAQLSGGEQQRAAVARALAGDPVMLLADEPTGNLDTINGEMIMELLAELNRDGTTIVMVTHDRHHARQAKRTIALLDGQLVPDALGASVM